MAKAVAGWIGLAGIALVALVVSLRSFEERAEKRAIFIVEPTPQIKVARVFRESPWKVRTVVGASAGLMSPSHVNAVDNDRIAVLDQSIGETWTIDATGSVVARRPVPKAVYAKTMTPVTGMAITPDGTAWFCNPNGHVVGFRPGQDLVSLPGAFSVQPFSPGVVARGSNGKDLFRVFDLGGKQLFSFGRLIHDQDALGTVLDGRMTVAVQGQTLFDVSAYGAFLSAYDSVGKQRFLVRTIDPQSLPEISFNYEGIGTIASTEGTNDVWDLAATATEVYVLLDVRGSPRNQRVIDVYRATDGQYEYSYYVPGTPRRLVRWPRTMFLSSRGGVAVMTLEDGTMGMDGGSR